MIKEYSRKVQCMCNITKVKKNFEIPNPAIHYFEEDEELS